ncbi:MAG: non-ribosomal peptide synthetase, partial [Chloroflexi bacterium]|nr:non-ribosomal peptide synthetase [Chloroflexota bacterium]
EVAYAPPTNELGESIAEIWRGLLNVQQIGINDNFFDIGGHSLFAVQAHRQIQQITEKKLSITDIFRFPTIRSLVAHLSQDSNGKGNGSQTAVKQSADRAASRREKMAQRRKRRQQG